MDRCRVFIAVAVLSVFLFSALAQPADMAEGMFSPDAAKLFYKTAYDILSCGRVGASEFEQAMALFEAASAIDGKDTSTIADILMFGSEAPDNSHDEYLYGILGGYLRGGGVDVEVAKKAVVHLLEGKNSRQQRETVLADMLRFAENENPAVASELAAQLALLSIEKADYNAALANLSFAYSANAYNYFAFAKLDELTKQSGYEILPVVYAKHLRRMTAADTLNVDTALTFAEYLDNMGLYEDSFAAYGFCAAQYEYITSGKSLPASIYLPWAKAGYNTKNAHENCAAVLHKVRSQGGFDLVVEGISGAASRKMGDIKTGADVLMAAEAKGQQFYDTKPSGGKVTAEELAWFYCFAWPNAEKSLAWANKAYTKDPNAPQGRAIFGYALAMNNQPDIAREYVSSIAQSNQTAALTMAIVQLSAGDKTAAIEMLRKAVEMDPASIAAERAKALLTENGSDYVPAVSPEVIHQALGSDFGRKIVPDFVPPDKVLSVKFGFNGTEFLYAAEPDARLMITNISSEPLVIFDHGLFRGNIRIDAEIRGDISGRFENILTKKICPALPVSPGGYISIPLNLKSGLLGKTLATYPQAAFEIELTAYLDPVEKDGSVTSGLSGVGTAKAVIKRAGVNLTQQYLMQRLDALAKGQQGQKLRSIELFGGLLAEQYAISTGKSGLTYRHKQTEKAILTDALRRGLVDESWRVRIQTLGVLQLLPAPLEYDLTRAVADNLNHPSWPVRLMSIYVLRHKGGSDDFTKVLDWAAIYDANWHVRRMAVAMGGKEQAKSALDNRQEQTAPPMKNAVGTEIKE